MQIKRCVIVHFKIERVFITVVTRALNDGKCNPITPSDAKLSERRGDTAGGTTICLFFTTLSFHDTSESVES